MNLIDELLGKLDDEVWCETNSQATMLLREIQRLRRRPGGGMGRVYDATVDAIDTLIRIAPEPDTPEGQLLRDLTTAVRTYETHGARRDQT